MTQARYGLLVLAIIVRRVLISSSFYVNLRRADVQISLHYIISFSNEDYGRVTSISHIKDQLTGQKKQPPYKDPIPEEYYVKTNNTLPPQTRKANAAFVLLGELLKMLTTWA